MILNDKIDIALVEGEISTPDILEIPFMKDELILICGRNHKFAKLKGVEPKELEGEKFIIREKGSGTRKTFEDKMTEKKLSWEASWICNNTDTIKMSVAEGLGVSVISRCSCLNELSRKVLYEIPVKDISFEREFKVIYHKNKYLTGTIKRFMNLCMTSKYTI